MDQNVLQFVEKYFDSSSEISFLLFWAAVTFLKECPQRAPFSYSHGTVYEKKAFEGPTTIYMAAMVVPYSSN